MKSGGYLINYSDTIVEQLPLTVVNAASVSRNHEGLKRDGNISQHTHICETCTAPYSHDHVILDDAKEANLTLRC